MGLRSFGCDVMDEATIIKKFAFVSSLTNLDLSQICADFFLRMTRKISVSVCRPYRKTINLHHFSFKYKKLPDCSVVNKKSQSFFLVQSIIHGIQTKFWQALCDMNTNE